MLPLVKMLFDIKDMIPQGGRITYKLLPEEVKAKIDDLVIALLKSNAGLRRAVNRYVESKMNLARLYGSDKKYLSGKRKEFQKEAERLVANRITRTVKALCQKERDNRFTEEERQYYTEQLVIELERVSEIAELQYSTRKQSSWHRTIPLYIDKANGLWL